MTDDKIRLPDPAPRAPRPDTIAEAAASPIAPPGQSPRDHFMHCAICGGLFDGRDAAQVTLHGGGPHMRPPV